MADEDNEEINTGRKSIQQFVVFLCYFHNKQLVFLIKMGFPGLSTLDGPKIRRNSSIFKIFAMVHIEKLSKRDGFKRRGS
jgi:hypothetical protein